jgi:hypothetical protein
LACRSAERTAEALEAIKKVACHGATVEFIRLDLQDFASVRQVWPDGHFRIIVDTLKKQWIMFVCHEI